MSHSKIERSYFQLLGVGALLIASKYEEIYAPEVRDFVYITEKSFSKLEILDMEYRILSTLKFDILTVYPYTFLKRFHFVTGDNIQSLYLAQFILEYSIMEYNMLNYKSSLKAASSLYLARKILKLEPYWNGNLQIVSFYQERELKTCAKDLCKILELIPGVSLRACINKFSSDNFMEVAKLNIFK
jgi:hypothetical protein